MKSSAIYVYQLEVARNYLALSREFQEQQFYGKAEQTLLLALDKLPDHPFILSRLSNLYVKLDMPRKAMKVIQKLIKQHAEYTFPYYLRAKIFENAGEIPKAIRDYERALTNSRKDSHVLNRLFPLMIENGRAPEALKRIRKYQHLLMEPHIFAEFESEAHLAMKRYAAAFNKLRDVLLRDPSNRRLVKRYIQLSIHSSKKSPREVYEILQLSLPRVAALEEKELIEMEAEYLVYHRRFDEALATLDQILMKDPENYFYRKNRAVVMVEMGMVDESIDAFRQLFFEDCTDVETRQVLENYFLSQDKLEEWKLLIQQVLRQHSYRIDLFNYLRQIKDNQDWLFLCELSSDDFIGQIANFNLLKSDLQDVTYQKIPSYALEIFVSQLSIHGVIPEPFNLWKLILAERARKQLPPAFNLEDLEAAYPIWLFAIHLYFLFKSYGSRQVVFSPRHLQTELIGLTIEYENQCVSVDLSHFLDARKRRLKGLVKHDRGFKWRLNPGEFPPDLLYHEVLFFSRDQFCAAYEAMESLLSERLN